MCWARTLQPRTLRYEPANASQRPAGPTAFFVCGVIVAVFMAWGIGANDVANAFGTSVGAKALTLKQAVIVASFCEFGGAVLLGSGVTDTIKSGIAKVSAYQYAPELLMYGNLCALTGAGLWIALATFLELPVSTTHSIVGAIVGFSLVAAGGDSVVWYQAPAGGSTNPFPTGFVSIVMAWFITPLMAMVLAALLFQFTKIVVLHAKNPFNRSLLLFPFYTFITIWIVTYFVNQKGVNSWMKSHNYGCDCPSTNRTCSYTACSCPPGADTGKAPSRNKDGDWVLTGCEIPDGTNAWISAVVASVCTLASIAGMRWVRKLVERDYARMQADNEARERRVAARAAGKAEGGGKDSPPDAGSADGEAVAEAPAKPSRTPKLFQDMRKSRVWKAAMHGSNVDIHEVTLTDAKIKEMHGNAEVFDTKSELSFKYLQVCTACANSFAHGANDVANSIGPLAAIYAIWNCACTESKANVPIWMFVIGGAGLVVGLATYGYNIMRALGVKVCKLTNSRGYCAELTAAIIVIVSSRYGFPVSTTQVITGAIAGIGVLEALTARIRKQPHAGRRMNWLLLVKFFAGWVATLIVAGFTSAAFMAQGIYAPNRPMVNSREDFNAAITSTNKGIANVLANGTISNTTADANVTAIAVARNCSASMLNGLVNTIDSAVLLGAYQNGTWCLGNATLAGVIANATPPTTYFMPPLPLSMLPNPYDNIA